MYTITFRGHFETEKQEEFIAKLQKILEETDTTFFGNVQSFKEPDYVDFQKIETNNVGESEDQSTGTKDTTIQSSDI